MRAPLLIPHSNHPLPNIQIDFFSFALRTTAALWARCLLMAIITPAAEEEEGNLCVLLFLRIEARERERGKGEAWEWEQEWLIASVYWGRHIVTSSAVGRALRQQGNKRDINSSRLKAPIRPTATIRRIEIIYIYILYYIYWHHCCFCSCVFHPSACGITFAGRREPKAVSRWCIACIFEIVPPVCNALCRKRRRKN